MPYNDNTLIYVKHTQLKHQNKTYKSLKSSNKSNTLNIRNTTRHHGRKPTPLIHFLRSLQGQFCGTQFLISFLKLFREVN